MLSKQLLRTLNVTIVVPITRKGHAWPKTNHASNVTDQVILDSTAGPRDAVEGGFVDETSTTTEIADAEVSVTEAAEEVSLEVLPTEVGVHTEVTEVVEIISTTIRTLEIK